MLRRSFLFLAASAALTACASAPIASTKSAPVATRLVVLRHADRTFAMLNETGVERATHLPEALADLEIDAIYTTPRQRNIDTATPLAEARGLEVHNLDAMGAAAKILAAHAGETVVWVGNQENLGFFYAELGILRKPPVQFGEIDVITLPGSGGSPVIERRHYGA